MLKAIRSTGLAGLFGSTAAPVAAPPAAPLAAIIPPPDRDLYYRIGTMLSDHGLPPTPESYALAHGYLSGDPRIVAAVDGQAALTSAAVAGIMADDDAISPADLAGMVDEAQARFDRFAGIVEGSRADAASFGAALQEEAAGLAAGDRVAVRAIAALLDITRTMIASTERAETQLRVTAAEMTELRTSLAAARADAETDPLTGLLNRRAFCDRFDAARDAAPAVGPLTLALVDIDRFKAVNDAHGHDVGDRVIQLVARELSGGCPGHIVGRHGGEEFVLLFEGTAVPAVRALLDAVRDDLASRSLKVAGSGRDLGALTFSGGIVAVDGSDTCATAIRRADALLYRAKQAGRNQLED